MCALPAALLHWHSCDSPRLQPKLQSVKQLFVGTGRIPSKVLLKPQGRTNAHITTWILELFFLPNHCVFAVI